MTTITSICLPVSVHPDAPYIIYDADGSRVAECGDAFLHLWPGETGIEKLHDAETMAAELVRVINAHDDVMEMLKEAHAILDDPHSMDWCHPQISNARKVIVKALGAARGEPVS